MILKKSINAWSFPAEYSFEECIAAAKKAGFDAVEFNLDAGNAGHAFTMETTVEEILAVRALCERYGICPVSISSSLHGGRWAKADEESVAAAMAILEKQLQIARLMGADTILLVPGGMSEGITLAVSRENSLRNLRAAIPLIEGSGVTVGLENVWNGFFLSPYDMLSFLEELGSPVFSLYFDMGNMIAFSTSAFWCEIVGKHIAKLHIKDFKRNGGINSGGRFCNLLEGDADFPAVMAALKKQGFDGYLTAEVFRTDEAQPWGAFFQSVSEAEDTIIDYYNKA